MAPSKSDMLLSELQLDWKNLYSKILPKLATAKDPVQPRWPVHVDHCFGRIILDNTVGQGEKPWMQVVKAPAYRNMSDDQLKDAIDLGRKIESGTANLDELNEISLRVRGKKGTKSGKLTNQEVKAMQEKIVNKAKTVKEKSVEENQQGKSTKKRKVPTQQNEIGPLRKSARASKAA